MKHNFHKKINYIKNIWFILDNEKFHYSDLIEIKFENNITLTENFINYEKIILENLNNIIYIKSDILSLREVYFLNCKIHNFNSAAKIHEKGGLRYDLLEEYYINGKKFTYEEWLEHPKKIRHDRDKKLQLI